MKIRRILPAAASLLGLVLSCEPGDATKDPGPGPGMKDGPDPGPPAEEDMARPAGEAIDTPKGAWTWVDFPESVCNDGSMTGIGVRRTESKNVLIYLMGGGACWDYDTCFVKKTASLGPQGRDQFLLTSAVLASAEIFARSVFRDWNAVFVPYCTGDVHAGDNVATYALGGESQKFHHKGHANMVAYLKRITATWPDAGKVVISGSSAGGFGAVMNYDLVRKGFPGAKVYMVDDCGPPLLGDDIAPALRRAWTASWRLDKTLSTICATCGEDLGAVIPALSARYPKDRLALLAFTQDAVIRRYLMQSAAEFESKLGRLAVMLDRLPGFRYFFIKSDAHVMLFEPSKYRSGGVPLLDWLTQQVGDDPAWASQKP